MIPSYLPNGDRYFATIRDGAEETVLQENDVNLRFDSAGQALGYAKREIERRRLAANPPQPPVVDQSKVLLSEWKREKAEELRREREAFEMRTIKVETKRRRRIER